MKNVVVIGGGTGSYVALVGLKKYASKLNISAIVTVADSGGSAKQERDEFGLLPVSDVRKALLALSRDSNERRQRILRDLFSYRFVNGQAGLRGGTFGNLFLVALSNVLGSEQEAIEEAEMMLQTEGRVIPVSLKTSNLVTEYQNGQVIVGEHYLDNFPGDGSQRVIKCYLLPQIEANPKAIQAIKNADVIVFPPGDLYASLIANLLVGGVKEEVAASDATIVYALNLMTKYGQTYNLTAKEHLETLESYLGRKVDKILINNAPLPERDLSAYIDEMDFPVNDDLGEDPRSVRGDLLQHETVQQERGDLITRSYIRHSSGKLAEAILGIIEVN